jgi:PAS domain S-box-containing protein
MLIHPEVAALREILAGLDAGVFLARRGTDGLQITYANQALERLCGHASAELQGRDLTVFCPVRATLTEFQWFQNVERLTEHTRSQVRCQRKNGSLLWVDLSITPCQLRFKGKAVHYLGLMQDVTAQVAAEQALERSTTRQQLILDGIGSPVLGLTPDMQIMLCNDAYAAFVGSTVDQLVGRNLLELFPVFKQRRSYAVYQQVLASGQMQMLEGRMGDKYLHTVVYPTPWGILAIAEDYSERRQFEDELLNRDRLLLGFAQASALLAGGARDSRLISLALAELGRSAQVDRVYLYENHQEAESQASLASMRYEWHREGLASVIDDPSVQGIRLEEILPRWYSSFERGAPIHGLTRHLPPEERQRLEKHGVVSMLIVPVLIQRRFWGMVGFDDCANQREWRQSEIGVLLAAAASIGGAIARQDAEARLFQERSLLQQVIDSIPDLVYYKDPESVYLGCNTAFTRFAGRSKEWIIGHSDIELFPAEQASLQFDKDRLAIASRGARHDEEWVIYPDGRQILLDTLKVPFNDAVGNVVGVLGVSRDITDRRMTEQMQREFVDNVSHELRTPITALLGLAETLQRTDLGEEQRRPLLEKLTGQALRLTRLVDDILALSNLELAQQTMKRERVDLGQVGRAAFDALHSMAVDKQLSYAAQFAGEVVEVIGDATLLELLASNLLSNAIRYTPDGGQVKLQIAAEREQAVLIVSDTGIGIEPEARGRIFERFFRADKARSRAAGGTGLGLAIASQIATLHAGEIAVESMPGQGSTFTATFPRLQESAAPG